MRAKEKTERTEKVFRQIAEIRDFFGITVEEMWKDLNDNYFPENHGVKLGTLYKWTNPSSRIQPPAEKILTLLDWVNNNKKK